MPVNFKRRKNGTPRQRNQPFPVFEDGKIPDDIKQAKRDNAKNWNKANPERYQATKRRWYLRHKIKCPHCQASGSSIRGNGYSIKGLRRYLCRKCNRSFYSTRIRNRLKQQELKGEIRQKLLEFRMEHFYDELPPIPNNRRRTVPFMV